jgi:hypothetical protein
MITNLVEIKARLPDLEASIAQAEEMPMNTCQAAIFGQ